jgi:hypothetical protein
VYVLDYFSQRLFSLLESVDICSVLLHQDIVMLLLCGCKSCKRYCFCVDARVLRLIRLLELLRRHNVDIDERKHALRFGDASNDLILFVSIF